MVELVANNISVHADGVALVEDASVEIKPGQLLAVLGPNGAGKTTLLRALLGLQSTSVGSITLNGEDIAALTPPDRARQVAYLPQRRPLAWPNIVRDIVSLGRFGHGAALGNLGPVDAAAVDKAIVSCDLERFANRQIDKLSGGELARVHFARVIAAEAPLLVADEPVAELDPRHQFRIAELIRNYVNAGGGALVVLHEISIAARFADRLIWMIDGRIVADGSPRDTLTENRLREVYGVRSRINAVNGDIDVLIDGAS